MWFQKSILHTEGGENMLNELQVLELENQRVLTTEQLAAVYETVPKNIRSNYNNNKQHFIENKHYYLLKGEYLKEFLRTYDIGVQNKSKIRILYLWTERGANRHCKVLDTDKAWQQFDILEDTYFKKKEELPTSPPPMSMEDIMIYSLQEMKNVKLQLETQGKAIEQANNRITDIQDAIIVDTQNWRKWVNESIGKLAQSEIIIEEFGDLRYQKVRVSTYKELEKRAGCDLKIRLKRLKERLDKAGATKKVIKETGNIDVIERDKKLKEIYTTIIKDMLIKYSTEEKIMR